jgi:hypothetical protein
MRVGRHFLGCTGGGAGYTEQTSIGGRRRLAHRRGTDCRLLAMSHSFLTTRDETGGPWDFLIG